jgi:hypothetical protein
MPGGVGGGRLTVPLSRFSKDGTLLALRKITNHHLTNDFA